MKSIVKYIVQFRKGRASWDTTTFTNYEAAMEFRERLEAVGYKVDLTHVATWDRSDMVFGDADYHHDTVFAYC